MKLQPELKKILREIAPHRKMVMIVAVTGIVYGVSYPYLAYIVKDLVDHSASKEFSSVMMTAFAGMGLMVLAQICRYFHIFLMNFLTEIVTMQLRQKLQWKFMHLSMAFHNNYAHGSGGLISRILNDIKNIQDSMRIIADVFLHPLMLTILVVNLFILEWRLTLLLLMIFPFLFFILRSLSRSVRKYSPMGFDVLERMTSIIKESLDGVKIIQSFNLERLMSKKLKVEVDEFLRIRKICHARMELAGPSTELLATCAGLGVILYSSYQVIHGHASPGTYVGYLTTMLMLNQPLKRFQEAFVRSQELIVTTQRVFTIIEAPHEVAESERNLPFPAQWKRIEYRNVSFRYGVDYVLKNVSFEVERGQQIALVGESGSGKSTIVNLLERFYDPSEGGVFVDGIDIRDFRLSDLRGNIALVTQDVFLFSDTIEANILAGLGGSMGESGDGVPKLPMTVQAAAVSANAHEFISKLENGYQSRVGERGNLLSGGEKQRISIARALLKNSSILILDEATSALDTANEQEVQKGIDQLMKNRTAFIVAHRLSTIQNCDKIMVLKNGSISEVGNHTELLALKGDYARYVALQNQSGVN
ncbi:MAG TPA: ABC transporter ATP-binding protein [Pseudobdellovibrionaceae bacterium]|nr:ABC transporter ATP-binding protein [Pseudobdellovibrionaceae bacterium]